MAAITKEVFDLDDLTRYLKIPKSTLYKLAQRGGVPGQKVGKQWRFHKGAIDDWLNKQPRRKAGCSL